MKDARTRLRHPLRSLEEGHGHRPEDSSMEEEEEEEAVVRHKQPPCCGTAPS